MTVSAHEQQRAARRADASRRKPALALLAGCAAIVLTWMVILPAIARNDSVRDHIDRNRAHGIHPDAMFYTEVGAIDGVQLSYENGRPVGRSIRMGE